MPSSQRSLLSLSLAAALAVAGCHAQVPAAAPAPGQPLSPELARRAEILIRTRTKLPPDYLVQVGGRTPSEIPGYSTVEVSFTAPTGKVQTAPFLLSADGNTIAQFSKYDISQDPRGFVSAAGRPGRGAAPGAPVEIVVFDDLECPYCAKMHAALFPALTDRYVKQVRIVYRDFPIPQHPWAMRAAVDTNCLGTQSVPAYWNLVDTIHAHASELGGTEHSIDKANTQLDQDTLDEARKLKLDLSAVEACVKKQDTTAIDASLKMGDTLGVEATPVLFINGEKLEGAYPLADVFRMVDGALVAIGQTPPPPYIPPAAPATPGKPGTN